jgi:hypothetical protein
LTNGQMPFGMNSDPQGLGSGIMPAGMALDPNVVGGYGYGVYPYGGRPMMQFTPDGQPVTMQSTLPEGWPFGQPSTAVLSKGYSAPSSVPMSYSGTGAPVAPSSGNSVDWASRYLRPIPVPPWPLGDIMAEAQRRRDAWSQGGPLAYFAGGQQPAANGSGGPPLTLLPYYVGPNQQARPAGPFGPPQFGSSGTGAPRLPASMPTPMASIPSNVSYIGSQAGSSSTPVVPGGNLATSTGDMPRVRGVSLSPQIRAVVPTGDAHSATTTKAEVVKGVGTIVRGPHGSTYYDQNNNRIPEATFRAAHIAAIQRGRAPETPDSGMIGTFQQFSPAWHETYTIPGERMGHQLMNEADRWANHPTPNMAGAARAIISGPTYVGGQILSGSGKLYGETAPNVIANIMSGIQNANQSAGAGIAAGDALQAGNPVLANRLARQSMKSADELNRDQIAPVIHQIGRSIAKGNIPGQIEQAYETDPLNAAFNTAMAVDGARGAAGSVRGIVKATAPRSPRLTEPDVRPSPTPQVTKSRLPSGPVPTGSPRPGGVTVARAGDYWVKGVDPSKGQLTQAYARATLSNTAKALDRLGDTAAPHYYDGDNLWTQDVGTYQGSALSPDFLRDYLRGSWRLGTPFNDIKPRNMGTNGQVFDPALQPGFNTVISGGILGVGGMAADAAYNNYRSRVAEQNMNQPAPTVERIHRNTNHPFDVRKKLR